MKEMDYSYCVVKYVHDPVAGETLNVGVIVCAPTASFCAARLDYESERLARTFANFDRQHFERTLRQLETAIQQQSPITSASVKDVDVLRLRIWPDGDLSFQFGLMSVGLTDNPAVALERLYERMVTSQQPRQIHDQHVSDEAWVKYQLPLVPSAQRQAVA